MNTLDNECVVSKNTADHKLSNFKLKSKVKEILSYSQSIRDSLNSIFPHLLFHLGLHPTSRGLQSFETWGWEVCICVYINLRALGLASSPGPMNMMSSAAASISFWPLRVCLPSFLCNFGSFHEST